jgi:hypothetical protein
MTDTTVIRRTVEPFVRQQLSEEFGMPFYSRVVALTTGGTHEFDAVSEDGKVVAAIKSASGKTAGGNVPAGKIRGVEAELYYLSLASARTRTLVVTDQEFYEMICKRLTGRLAPGLSIRLVALPPQIQAKVRKMQKAASDEVRPVTA